MKSIILQSITVFDYSSNKKILRDKAQKIQSEYYKQTAGSYDNAHLACGTDDEHKLALFFVSSIIKLYSIRSILDVGAGTGRSLEFLLNEHPNLKIIGIEPVKELREQGYTKGISKSILIEGDGNKINFATGEFDLVCEFGVLHHVSKPHLMVSEMLRVSKQCIFISDSNNFGQGNLVSRWMKQIINLFGAWTLFNLIKTKGKRYQISEGDGVFYSYSVFNNYLQIKNHCRKIHLLNTKDGGRNLYRTASQVALLGIK
jgi:ubiquinone/menaquinone biosynthesis C-methylase UbiE